MSEIIIKSENLGKSYIIGHVKNEKYMALRDIITNNVKNIWSRIRNPQYHTHQNIEEFWALKDLSFEINKGDRIGVIGRNGAGKSTLLKVLSRITEPTTGKVTLNGRVASLLEVGTGFHPELTGRENVYLNGAILGMSRTEVKQKFDQIIEFADVEQFLDTPVKRYSSGMYVRLAFAVAAHLEPEILVVDEVLAVGDMEFREKCLGKMKDVAEGGRTVIFVSHNMAAIESLCKKTMVLESGRKIFFGKTSEAIEIYKNSVEKGSIVKLSERVDREGKGNIKLRDINLFNNEGRSTNKFSIGNTILIKIRIKNFYHSDTSVTLALTINTLYEKLISCDSDLKGEKFTISGDSECTFVCKLKNPPLNFGSYHINLAIFNGGEPEDWVRSAAVFSIESGEYDNRITTNPFPVLSQFVWQSEY